MAGSSARKGPKVQKHHAFYVLVMVTGWLLPPLAVLMRFGPYRDFFINIIFTLCGYIPGHVHNFYLQNIRNNKGRGRTPKWAIKYGFVKDGKEKAARDREWANRYDQNHGHNTYDDEGYTDEFGNNVPAGRTTGGEALEREALKNQRKQRIESSGGDGLDHSLYGPTAPPTQNGNRDPGNYQVAGFDALPGAGDQAIRGEHKGFKHLIGRDKHTNGKDRFARMEDGRQAYGTGEPDGDGEDWLNQDPLSGPRTGNGVNGVPRNKQQEPAAGDDWLHKQDLYSSSMANGERATLNRPKGKRDDSSGPGLIDTSGDLNHRF